MAEQTVEDPGVEPSEEPSDQEKYEVLLSNHIKGLDIISI